MPIDQRLQWQMFQQSLEEIDANNDTVIQLNCSRVPAQKGVYSLILSSGGTGMGALLETKGLITRTCCLSEEERDKPTDQVRYIAFDTDRRVEGKTSSRSTGGVKLDRDKGEYVQMGMTGIRDYLSEKYRMQVPDYISSWLDFSMDPDGAVGTEGAGGIRQCGRLLMFSNIGLVRTAITNALTEMLKDKEDVQAVNIYVLAGISGGTGSGTFLDLAYIARRVAEDVYPDSGKIHMYGYLFLPDVNLSKKPPEEQAQKTRNNGYAALKELDYLMSIHDEGGHFRQKYCEGFEVDYDSAPFAYVHLIGATGENGFMFKDPYLSSQQVVAQSITSFVAEELPTRAGGGFAMSSHYVNIKAGVEHHNSLMPERHNKYLVLGSYSYEIPIDRIMLYVTSLLFEKMSGMFSREPTPEDISDVISDLDLNVERFTNFLIGNRQEYTVVATPPTWAALFGPAATYDLIAMANALIIKMGETLARRCEKKFEGFEELFREKCGEYFTDPRRGPYWLNRVIVNASDDCLGLAAYLSKGATMARSRVAGDLRVDLEAAVKEVERLVKLGPDTGPLPLGARDTVAREFTEAVQRFVDLRVEEMALTLLAGALESCRKTVMDLNHQCFEVVVKVLNSLKDLAKHNADILTKTELVEDNQGRTFSWEPLSISDVSDTIRAVFDKDGAAEKAVQAFTKAVYEKAFEWAAGNIDITGFIREFLDRNLSNIANLTLEDYVVGALHGITLASSITRSLGPTVVSKSVPMIKLGPTYDVGGQYWMVSIPSKCPNILANFQNYVNTSGNIATNITIQASGINTRIFAQSVRCAVPLWSFGPLSEYEAVYLDHNGNAGKHLYREWVDLPCPIPFRSRPVGEGTYPPSVQLVEDEQRELFDRCVKLRIIRATTGSSGKSYFLHIAQAPDLARFGDDALTEGKKPSPDKMMDAIEELEGMERQLAKKPLPDVPPVGEGGTPPYRIILLPIPERGKPDTTDEVAREAFLGKYDLIRMARKEVEKYESISRRKAEIEAMLDELDAPARRAARLIALLTTGTVRYVRESSNERYVYGEKSLELVHVGDRFDWREALLSDAFEAMGESDDESEVLVYQRLVEAATEQFKKMDADLESLRGKEKRLQVVLKGFQERCVELADGVRRRSAPRGVTQKTVGVYQVLVSEAENQLRLTRKRIQELTRPQTVDDTEEFSI